MNDSSAHAHTLLRAYALRLLLFRGVKEARDDRERGQFAR